MANKKSDVPAKEAYVKELNARGYEARIASTPADIIAEKGGETWYYEIKMTGCNDRYFGAATLTEWGRAFKDPEHFRFVVAIADETYEHFEFREYTPAAFMEISTIPPFKVYFNIDLIGKPKKKSNRKRKSVPLTKENFLKMDECYSHLDRGDK